MAETQPGQQFAPVGPWLISFHSWRIRLHKERQKNGSQKTTLAPSQHLSHSGPSSSAVSLTTSFIADPTDPLDLPAASTDSLHTVVKVSHLKSGTCISLLGFSGNENSCMRKSGNTQKQSTTNEEVSWWIDLYSHLLISTPFFPKIQSSSITHL